MRLLSRQLKGLSVTAIIVSTLTLLVATTKVLAEEQVKRVLFTNVDVFNGTDNKLYQDHNVLVEGNLITRISESAIDVADAEVIHGKGKTLMPGLIDNHVHLMLPGPTLAAMEANTTWEDFAIHGVAMSEMYLLQGFTTVRDAGGANAGLQRGIDSGKIIGPRLYPSGAFIGGRGSHSDFANYSSQPGAATQLSSLNMSREVDGQDATIKAARNNFRMGASQLKVMQSGGVTSAFDPWQMEGRTVNEIETAVEIASQYGSYVMAHSYRKESILRALNAGVKSIEHGFMFDCEIAEVMNEKGAFITTNLTAFDKGLLDIPAVKNVPSSYRKALSAVAAFGDYIENMKSCPVKRGHHTDCVGSVSACQKQIAYEKYLNGDFFGPYTALVSMTSVGGEIAAMTGDFINPYPEGKLGVVEKGAYADLLLIDGNPLEDLSLIGTSNKWFDAPEPPKSPKGIKVIMKDGVIYKNTL